MFDLFRSRAKAVRILLSAMLGIVALSMLVYLIPGAGTPTGDRNEQVIAEIGKEPVTLQQVELQIHNRLQGAKIPPELVESYVPELIDEAIAARAMAYQAKVMGFDVSDRDLANIIRSQQFGSLPPDQYRQYVEQQLNMPVADFENNLRVLAYQNELLQIAMEGVVVTPAEVEAAYRHQNEKIKLEYIAVIPEKLVAELKPTDAELKAYFDSNKGFFPIPETRDVQLIIADQAKVGEGIPVTDAQIQAFYASHQDQFRTPERVHARHILLATTGKSDAEKAAIKAKAEDLLKQVKGGADFAKVAQKNSEDPGSAPKGGDLGWVVKGQMVKEFEDTTFSLKAQEISNVITTQYGFHIIQVLEKEAARLRTLDEMKADITTAIRGQSVFDRMQTLADKAHDQLVKAPQNAQQIANQLGLTYLTLSNYRPGEPILPLATDPQLGTAIISMKKGEVSPVVQANNKLAMAVLTSVNAPHPAQFSEVQAMVKQSYVQQRSIGLVSERLKKLQDLVKSSGGDLKAAAKGAGLEVKTADFFSRDGAAEAIGPGRAFSEAFDKPDGTIIGPIPVGGQTFIGKVVERQGADLAKLGEQRATIVTQIKSQRAQEVAPLVQDSVITRLIEEGKIKKHQDVINRLIARYRS